MYFSVITFEIDLEVTDVANNMPPHNRSEGTYLKHTRSTFIPGLSSAENVARKHGDRFTLFGREALYLRRLIEKGLCPSVKIQHISEEIAAPTSGGMLFGGIASESLS